MPQNPHQALKNSVDALLANGQSTVSPGVSVMVKAGGKVLYQNSFGLADVKLNLPISAQTNFRLASVSKQFTAAAVALLQQAGKLSFDDSLSRFFPDLPQVFSGITLHQLLNHTSGLPDYEDFVPPQQLTQVTDAQVLEIISALAKPLFEPGSAFRYSNTGYVLLGLIVEQVSATTYSEFLETHIFGPTRMEHSILFQKNVSIAQRAMGYAPHPNTGFQLADQSLTSATSGDGCIYSSVSDYALWDQFLAKQELLNLESLLNHNAAVINNHPCWKYGMGWFFEQRPDGTLEMFHTGNSSGFSHLVLRIPAEEVLVVAFSNVADHPALLPGLLETLVHHQAFQLRSDLVWALPSLTR